MELETTFNRFSLKFNVWKLETTYNRFSLKFNVWKLGRTFNSFWLNSQRTGPLGSGDSSVVRAPDS